MLLRLFSNLRVNPLDFILSFSVCDEFPYPGIMCLLKIVYNSAIPFLGIHPKEMKAGSQRDIYIPMFIATVAKKKMEATQVFISG